MAKFDDVDAEIEATLAGMRETVFTVVVSFILDHPESDDPEQFFQENLGTRVLTFTNAPDAEKAGHAGEEAVVQMCEAQHGKAPWSVWASAIFVGQPVQARVPAFARLEGV